MPKIRCLISNKTKPDRHHVLSRGAGGPDDDWNLMPLSRQHHTEVHQIGLTTFANKYPKVKNWLLAHGWEFNELLKKWKHK